ncbi:hypothetical protein ScPMuIL_000566, partial [Solemya velum]
KPYKCDLCEAAFAAKQVLNNHKMMHTGVKTFTCDLCEAAFTNKGHLNNHKMIHTGEKPYECELCKVAFKLKGSLNRHKRIHTDLGLKSIPNDYRSPRGRKPLKHPNGSTRIRTHDPCITNRVRYHCAIRATNCVTTTLYMHPCV